MFHVVCSCLHPLQCFCCISGLRSYISIDCHEAFVSSASKDRDELIRFQGQKVTIAGDIQDSTLQIRGLKHTSSSNHPVYSYCAVFTTRAYVVFYVRLSACDSDNSRLDLHGLSTAEALHVLSTALSEREAGTYCMCTV